VKTLLQAGLICALALGCGAARAQEAHYPSRTIRIVVPASPGGPLDAGGRILADALKTVWPVPIVVENRAGAGTSTGAAAVAAAPPDGYTLLTITDSISINPLLYPNAGYDPVKSFEPIALLATATQILVVRPDLGVHDFRQFMEFAGRKRDAVNMASAGTGTLSHLTEVLLEQRSGFQTTHIPFKGAAPALTALLGDHVDAMWVMPAPAMPHLRSGKLLPIAVTSALRDPSLPAVPTVEESGVADFRIENWQGLFAPAGTPQPVIDKIAATVAEVLKTPEVTGRLAAIGFEARGDGPAVVRARVSVDLPRWSGVVRAAGIRAGE
jgi:tripartite-type tricarboxylate transporter receptor subunit TctC